jgi:hypothetical protein
VRLHVRNLRSQGGSFIFVALPMISYEATRTCTGIRYVQEHFDNLWIELTPGPASDLLPRRRECVRHVVEAISDKHIKRIGDRNDTLHQHCRWRPRGWRVSSFLREQFYGDRLRWSPPLRMPSH